MYRKINQLLFNGDIQYFFWQNCVHFLQILLILFVTLRFVDVFSTSVFSLYLTSKSTFRNSEVTDKSVASLPTAVYQKMKLTTLICGFSDNLWYVLVLFRQFLDIESITLRFNNVFFTSRFSVILTFLHMFKFQENTPFSFIR